MTVINVRREELELAAEGADGSSKPAEPVARQDGSGDHAPGVSMMYRMFG